MAVRGPGFKRADVAQLVEHSLGKGEVTSSILVISSRDASAQWTVHSEQLPSGVEMPCGRGTVHCPLLTVHCFQAGVTQW